MSPQSDFSLVFEQLKSILKPFAPRLTITADTSTAYSLDGPYSEKYKKDIFSPRHRPRKIMFPSISCLFTRFPNY